MTLLLEQDLTALSDLEIHAAGAEVVTWQGEAALRLENGLALLPECRHTGASIEVVVGTDGPAYPGIAFRVADMLNYELAYAVPHASGQWDALQYDPVYHGSNTWQLYHGPAYQRAATVPTGRWFRFRVDFCGDRAAIAVDGQTPLVVERLSRPLAAGRLGLWTFRPACFRQLRVSTCNASDIPAGVAPAAPEAALDAWFVEGYGVVRCEPNGLLNLNRFLPASLGEVRLARRFEVPGGGSVSFSFGFSDHLSLALDGETIYEGEHTFSGFEDRASRGYAELGTYAVRREVAPGTHQLVAALRVSEGFGWGLALAARAEGLRWLPA